jgi:hypothetical protein
MRHLRFLLIAGIFLSVACKAQDLGKNFIAVTTGAGIPIGVFASKDPNSIKSGLAKNGLVINLEYIHYFKNKMGFCIGLRRSVFPLDVDRLTNSHPNITAFSEPWRVLLAYAGLNRRKRLRDKIVLSYEAAIALATSKYPEAIITTNTGSGVVTNNITSNTGKAPALIVGVGFKYILSPKIYLAMKFDYLTTSPKFVVTQTVYSGQSSRSFNSHYTQNIQAITAGLSVCYKIGK